MIDDPEEEAWKDMERRSVLKMPLRVKSFEDAFEDYIRNPGAPRTAGDEEVRRHFNAGWVAGIRNEWAKERND